MPQEDNLLTHDYSYLQLIWHTYPFIYSYCKIFIPSTIGSNPTFMINDTTGTQDWSFHVYGSGESLASGNNHMSLVIEEYKGDIDDRTT